MFCTGRILLYSVSPGKGWGNVKLTYISSAKISWPHLCCPLHWQDPTPPGIAADRPERPRFALFCSLGTISGWLWEGLGLTCQAEQLISLELQRQLGWIFTIVSVQLNQVCHGFFWLVKYEGTLKAEKRY